MGNPSLRVRRALGWRALLALPLLAGCAGLQRDIHLAPLYTNISTAGGGREVEALFGVLRIRRPSPREPVNEWALRPLIKVTLQPNGDSLARFLVPLGTHRKSERDLVNQLLPIWRYQKERDENGRVSFWRFFSLPGILWSKDDTGRVVRAFFPFGGVVEGYLTYDRVTFVLFPLFVQARRAGFSSVNWLFPIFKYGKGPKGRTFRVWPLFGRSYRRGSFDNRFVLWPLFHLQESRLWDKQGTRQRTWMLWPLVGHTRAGDFCSTSILWPFFGWSSNPKTGFWSWDGPWPLVRILRPANAGEPRRTRFWPIWSHYSGDGLESTWFLWPFFNRRQEDTRAGRRTSQYLLPLWQHWEHDADGVHTEWSKLWPLFQNKTAPDHGRFAFPALNPLWNLPEIDDHYAWLYEVITREVQGSNIKERSWGGLWRREADENEDRSSLAGLWSNRAYWEGGQRVVDTSFLFGLIRLRSSGPRRGFMTPAFPGPGWPIDRTPAPVQIPVETRP